MQEARRRPMRTLFYLSESQLERIKPFFPVLTVLPVWMIGVSSAASSTSSSTDFSGRMHLMSTAPTKHCTIALSGGAGSVFSIKFSLCWQAKHLLMAP